MSGSMLQHSLPMECVQDVFKWLPPTQALKFRRLCKWVDASLADDGFARRNVACFVRVHRKHPRQRDADADGDAAEMGDDAADGAKMDLDTSAEDGGGLASPLQRNKVLVALVQHRFNCSQFTALDAHVFLLWPRSHQRVYAQTELPQTKLIWSKVSALKGASIPAPLLHLPRLRHLSLSENGLTGRIPFTLGNLLPSLETLDLSCNKLVGSIPISITRLQHLQLLDLSRNRLSETIPSSLGALQNLVVLFLNGNKFSGEIPASIWTLSRLAALKLDNNALQGCLPATIEGLRGVELLDLSSNRLEGPLPPQLGFLTQVYMLYLNWNKFSGSIPPTLGLLPQLLTLNVEGNRLSGSVPEELCSLRQLQTLDMSGNAMLSGPLPTHLHRLPFLRYLGIERTGITT
ncbi:hypothetical protein BC830DRAFT_1153231 [Chytriomyces sp. MP71]|nr:hypothetical protein BC830DRAFT_1153231 [Chytriomyces sp. MP71]